MNWTRGGFRSPPPKYPQGWVAGPLQDSLHPNASAEVWHHSDHAGGRAYFAAVTGTEAILAPFCTAQI